MNAAVVHGPFARAGIWIRKNLALSVILLILLVVLLGYVLWPMLATARRSFSVGKSISEGFSTQAWSAFFSSRTQLNAVAGSVVLSALSVLLAGALGTVLAILLTRWEFPGRRICQVLALLPIALPPLMGVWSFKLLFGVGGRIPFAMQEWFGISQQSLWLNGLAGVLLVHTMTMYPYFYLTVRAGMQAMDVSLEEAAASLGASRARVWAQIIIPMLTPAFIAAGLLTFMSAMASYTAPMLFQYTNVMTQQIVLAKMGGDMRTASVISTVLALLSIVFLIAIRLYENSRSFRTQSKGGGRRRSVSTSWYGKVIVALIAVPLTIFLVLPIIMIFLWSITARGGWLTSILPTEYTGEWYKLMLTGTDFWRPVLNSVLLSLLAVGGAVVVGVIAAYALSRLRTRSKLLLDLIIMLPWALPGTVVAINLITAFSGPSPLAGGHVLVGTFGILVVAYFVRFNPLIFRSTGANLSQLDPGLEDAARSLGASWWFSFRTVVLPLLKPGILAGTLLAFVDGVGEFVASVLLYTPDWVPLSIAINNENYQGNYGVGATYGMIQVAMILAVVLITQREGKDDRVVTSL